MRKKQKILFTLSLLGMVAGMALSIAEYSPMPMVFFL